jgi:hypothetical protein
LPFSKASRVAVVNAATCNGTRTTGCQRHFPTLPVGRAPLLVTADAHTGTVYVANGYLPGTLSLFKATRR